MTYSTLDLLPPLTPSKPGSTMFAKAFKAKSKSDMATAKKLMKLMEAKGKTVTLVTIGAVSVTTADTHQTTSVVSNPWDTGQS